MKNTFSKTTDRIRRGAALSAVALLGFGLVGHGAMAQNFSTDTASQRDRDGGQYIPGIWVDPDGCEHWVMDDGVEGFMTPHLTRDGKPVCRQLNTCAQLNSDTLFATDSAVVGATGRARLVEFFQKAGARAYTVVGHTDNIASDEYNLGLSKRRAAAVASIGKAAGANIADIRGMGEREPRASNATAQGRQQNRRAEIVCIR